MAARTLTLTALGRNLVIKLTGLSRYVWPTARPAGARYATVSSDGTALRSTR